MVHTLLLLLSLSAWADPDGIATVDGVEISPIAVQTRAARMAPADGVALSGAERMEALDDVIDQELLYQAALRQGYGEDPQVLKVTVNLLLREAVYGQVRNADFSDEDLQAYFAAHPDEFVVPAKRQIKAIVILDEGRTEEEARALIEQVYARVRDDIAAFKDAAVELDESPYARRGGDIGYKSREDSLIEPALLEQAWALDVGGLSEPIRTDRGWAVVYVPGERPQIVRSYAQVKGAVLRAAKNERFAQLYESYVTKIADDSVILVDRAWWRAHGAGELPWGAQTKRRLGHVATLDGQPVAPGEGALSEVLADALLLRVAREQGFAADPKVKQVAANLLLREEVYSQVSSDDFDDDMLRAYFEAHREAFIVPEKVQIMRILIRAGEGRSTSEARALAESIRLEVMADPGGFKALAVEHSADVYRRRGGDLGFVSEQGKPNVDQRVVEVAFSLETRQVSEVFEADGGFNVVYVAGRRERLERAFDQMRGSVLRKMKNDAYKALYMEYLAELREGARIEVDRAALDALEIHSMRREPSIGLER